MKYREELPEGCPPAGAEQVNSDRDVFRLVRQSPPSQDDFRSRRAENPQAIFSVSECQARGLSVFADRRDCEKARKLPTLRGRLICRVRLVTGAGNLLETGGRSHHTWWPLAEYDILSRCQVEAA
jgi:hypothetical protein